MDAPSELIEPTEDEKAAKDEADERVAEQAAQALGAAMRNPVDRSTLGRAAAAGVPAPLFQMTARNLNLAFRTLLMPTAANFETPVKFEIRRDRTRISVEDGQRTFWLDLPANNPEAEEAGVAFTTRFGPLAGLGSLYRGGSDDSVYAFEFLPAEETLRLRQRRFSGDLAALPAVVSPLPFADEAPSSQPCDPRLLRRLLSIAGSFLPPPRDARPEHSHICLRGLRTQAGGHRVWCRLDTVSAAVAELSVAREDAGQLSRALRRMDPKRAALFDFGDRKVFTDGVVGFAFEGSKAPYFDNSAPFEAPILTQIELQGHEAHKWIPGLFFYGPKDTNVPIRLTFSQHLLTLELEGRDRHGFQGTCPIPSCSIPAMADGAPDVHIQVNHLDLIRAVDALTTNTTLLSVLADNRGEPRILMVTAQSDDLQCRVLLPTFTPVAPETSTARRGAS